MLKSNSSCSQLKEERRHPFSIEKQFKFGSLLSLQSIILSSSDITEAIAAAMLAFSGAAIFAFKQTVPSLAGCHTRAPHVTATSFSKDANKSIA